jgi:hypothetical protein
MVLPHEVRVLERSSMRASAIDASTGRSSLRPAACALYRVGIRHATPLRWHRNSRNAGGDDGADGGSLSRSAR